MAELNMHTSEASAPGESTAGEQQQRQQAAAGEQAPQLFTGGGSRRRRRKEEMGPDYGHERIRLHKGDEINPYADAEDARYGLDKRHVALITLCVLLVAVFLVACLMPTNMFSIMYRSDHSAGGYAREVAENFKEFLNIIPSGGTSDYASYVFTILATVIAGAAMGLSGGVFQGALKNALASPSTLGITQGGTLGAVLYAVFVYPSTISAGYSGSASDYRALLEQAGPVGYLWEVYGSFACSLIGCVVVVLVIMAMALIAGRGKVSNVSLIIAGQVFSALIGVVLTWLRYYLERTASPETVEALIGATSTTFAGPYTFASTAVFAVPTIICFIVTIALTPRLTLLAFNDEEARSMGISTARTRNLMVAVCTIMTALVVSFCGPVGFVGFLVPHIARRFLGPDFKFLLPGCMVLGSILVCATYVLTEMGIPWLPSGSSGFFTSLIGCIAFVVIALRTRGDKRAEWF